MVFVVVTAGAASDGAIILLLLFNVRYIVSFHTQVVKCP